MERNYLRFFVSTHCDHQWKRWKSVREHYPISLNCEKTKKFLQLILNLSNKFPSLLRTPPILHFWIISHPLIKVVENWWDFPDIFFLLLISWIKEKLSTIEKNLFFSKIWKCYDITRPSTREKHLIISLLFCLIPVT